MKDWCPDTRVNGRVANEAFLVRNVQEGAVVHTCVVRDSAAEDFGVPSVEVGVEVNDGHLAPVSESGAESRQSCGVVASQGDDAGSVVGCCVCFSGGDELQKNEHTVF